MVALELAVSVPVVALNVAEEPPAATETDAGTVKAELLLESDTLAPPVGALPLVFTVHVELLELPKLEGEQDTELIVGHAPPVTMPPVEETDTK